MLNHYIRGGGAILSPCSQGIGTILSLCARNRLGQFCPPVFTAGRDSFPSFVFLKSYSHFFLQFIISFTGLESADQLEVNFEHV